MQKLTNNPADIDISLLKQNIKSLVRHDEYADIETKIKGIKLEEDIVKHLATFYNEKCPTEKENITEIIPLLKYKTFDNYEHPCQLLNFILRTEETPNLVSALLLNQEDILSHAVTSYVSHDGESLPLDDLMARKIKKYYVEKLEYAKANIQEKPVPDIVKIKRATKEKLEYLKTKLKGISNNSNPAIIDFEEEKKSRSK